MWSTSFNFSWKSYNSVQKNSFFTRLPHACCCHDSPQQAHLYAPMSARCRALTIRDRMWVNRGLDMRLIHVHTFPGWTVIYNAILVSYLQVCVCTVLLIRIIIKQLKPLKLSILLKRAKLFCANVKTVLTLLGLRAPSVQNKRMLSSHNSLLFNPPQSE